MDSYCAIHKSQSLIKKAACYKNLENPTHIDLLLTK